MSNSSGKIMAGFLLGAAAGLTVGLLYAPKSGAETRKDIEKKAKDYSEDAIQKIQGKIDDLKKHLGDLTEETKSKVKSAAEETRTKAKSAAEKAVK